MSKTELGLIGREYRGADLGDERRNARLALIGESLATKPGSGFPELMRGNAELEALYRFLNNPGFNAEEIVQPHMDASVERACAFDEVLAIHDTTHIDLPGPSREGMGVTTLGKSGFLAHISLLATIEGSPLGVIGMKTWSRNGEKWRARKNRAQVERHDPNRESQRWIAGVDATEEALSGRAVSAIHVADSEGDFFELLSSMRAGESRFVVRAAQLGRMVNDTPEPLRDVLDRLEAQHHRKVQLSERMTAPSNLGRPESKRNAPRKAREATLSIAATTIGVNRTKYVRGPGEPFVINVVRVWEETPPKGQQGVEWILLTTEPIKTKANLLRVVDIYRRRWLIEEYFKALKTGCSIERRRVESYGAMCKVLALFIPIACRLLQLKGLHRENPGLGAEAALGKLDCYLLVQGQNRPTAPPKTVDDALMLLARMGGHIKNNGPPGWITLSRGYERLLTLRLGWVLAANFYEKL
jgi:hypothetical protein